MTGVQTCALPISDEAVKTRLNQTATVEFRVEKAAMIWTTALKTKHYWVVHFTPKTGLKDGSEIQLCVTYKAATQLRNLGLFNDADLRPGGYFEGKLIRLTGKVESWPDREKKGKTIYRICVFDLEQLEVVR